MSLIEKIKNTLGMYQLKRYAPDPSIQRRFTGLEQAREVGIIYNGINITEEATVHKYAHELKSRGIKVYLMGFVDLKILPGNKKFSLQSEYVWKEKLNGINLPERSKISRFLSTEFDLLLSIYHTPLLPMLAISAYSKAHYRVGPSMPDGTLWFDAMIDTQGNTDLHFLIEQIDFYLRSISYA